MPGYAQQPAQPVVYLHCVMAERPRIRAEPGQGYDTLLNVKFVDSLDGRSTRVVGARFAVSGGLSLDQRHRSHYHVVNPSSATRAL